MSVPPVVRYLIPCDDVRVDETNAALVSIVGVMSAIRSAADPPYPLHRPLLCVFVMLTNCRGPILGQIVIIEADTGDTVSATTEHVLSLPTDPLEIACYSFRIGAVYFPAAGLYWVQFWCDGAMLHQMPLLLR